MLLNQPFQRNRHYGVEVLNKKCVEEGLTIPAKPYYSIPEMKLKCRIIRKGNIL